MIVVKDIKINKFKSPNTALCTVYADTKSEVTANATIENLPDDVEIEEGSTLYTADLDVAVMKSDGTWKWS